MPTASPEAATKALLYLGGYTGLRLEATFHTALADRVSEGIATYTNMQVGCCVHLGPCLAQGLY